MKIILNLLLVFFCVKIVAQENQSIKKEITQIIKYETNIDYKETPGFVIGMIDQDQVYTFNFGAKSLNDSTKLSANDVFEIGGITKVYTALIFEKIKLKYHLEFNVSINDYLPVKNPSFDRCTIEKLLTHTSGLPKYIPGWGSLEGDTDDPYIDFNQKNLEEFYSTYTLTAADSTQYIYSHVNYILLGWILEIITGETYTDLLKEYLNINTGQAVNIVGYDKSMKPTKPWSTHLFMPSLGVSSTLNDLLSLTKLLLDAQDPAVNEIMKVKTMKVRNQKGIVARGLQAIALNKKATVYFHTGRTEGHYSFLAIEPNTKTGVVILANSSTGADLLGINILRMMNKNWKRKS